MHFHSALATWTDVACCPDQTKTYQDINENGNRDV